MRSRLTPALVAAFLALLGVACGSSSVPQASSGGAAKAVTVTIKNIAFQPDRVQIGAGQSVTWQFDDGQVPHSVTAADKSFDSGVKTSGSFTHRFDKAGTYDYICTVHPQQMKATIVVG